MQKSTNQEIALTRRLQWDDIRYFLALSRSGSLSGAARSLGVEHSTVARRVDALEQTLGLKLFDRLPRGWVLTAEGHELSAQAAKLDEEAQAFARLAVGASAIEGTVRISAPPVLASHVLVPRLARRREDWSRIQVEIIGEAREANLARGEADLALRMSRPTAPGLVVRKVGQLRYGLYGAPLWHQRPEADWVFLGYDESLSQVPQQRWLTKIAGDRPFVFRSNDLSALVQAAVEGLGVTTIPHVLAAGQPGLQRMPTALEETGRDVWLVMHPDTKRSPRIRLMADLVFETLGEALGAF